MPLETGRWQTFLDDVAKKLEGAWKDLDKETIYSRFVYEQSTKMHTMREISLQNMPSLDRLPENSPFPELIADEGWAQSYTQTQWAGEACITIPMMEFSRTDLIGWQTRQLKQSPHKTREIIGATYLMYGATAQTSVPFVGGAPLINSIGGDGLTLFNTAHTFRGDAVRTWSNKAASYVDLTEGGVIAVYNDIAGWKDNTGAPFNVSPTDMIYPVNKTANYLKVRKSLLEPGSANNAINVANDLFKGGGTQQKWVGTTNNWWVMTDADKETFALKMYIGIKDRSYRGQDPRTKAEYVSVMFSVAHGANELRSLYGVFA